jgi:hypothetical protein
VKPGLDDPARSTIGLLTLGQVATAWFGSRDFASNDFADPGFRAWLTDLADAVPTFAATRGTPLDQMLAAGPSAYDLVGSTEAEGGPAIAGSRDSDRLGISYAGPMTTADVVLVTLRGSDRADRLSEIASSEQAAEILADAGWRVEGFPSAGHVADIELPDDNGLPRPGVLEALRQL